MKQLLSFILITIFFIGCSVKEQKVQIKLPEKNNIDSLSQPKVDIIDEKIDSFNGLNIIEDNVPIFSNNEVMKVAFIYPSKLVGNYAKSSMNTILGYFDYKKIKYDIKVFDTLNEEEIGVRDAFKSAKDEGFTNVLALFTPRVIPFIHTLDTSDLKIYLPLTNKDNFGSTNYNFIYGSISYEDQIRKLLDYSNTNNTMFYQESFLGTKIKALYDSTAVDVKVVKEIKKDRNYFKGIVKDYRINNSTLFLNTPIVKTSILLSQLRAYDIYPKVILSTQVNYNPKILTLTQVKDRSNFVVANSIDNVDDNLRDSINTYGADIIYNWVDYSTLIGINYLYDENRSGLIETKIVDNQVMYEPKLYITTSYGFSQIK